jgi:cellulose synthase/poly-beta-1,6-N-acetylglucosamine synthase-like glycosyltransferase
MVILWVALALMGAVPLYAYLGYPILLSLLSRGRPRGAQAGDAPEWPTVSITVPAYNEQAVIAATLDRLLELDYPRDRLQMLVVSDASTDNTDEIVRSYQSRGVEMIRLPERGGKTAAENAARQHLRGSIVVNTDASVQLHPASLRPLIAAFCDSTVGVASGRDVSVARVGADANVGESGYVGYEMWVRDLETAIGGIVGASGCFYASRIELHKEIVPEALSRDFAAPLIAHEHGYRSVSVPDAICFVPRAPSLRREYRRKVRTMSRGLQTLYYKRRLMNPLRHGWFAWMVISHKLVRWLVPWAVLLGLVGALIAAGEIPLLRLPLAAALGIAGVCAAVGWARPKHRLPRVVAIPAYVVWGLIAGIHAWINALRGDLTPTWEPTRRGSVGSAVPGAPGHE